MREAIKTSNDASSLGRASAFTRSKTQLFPLEVVRMENLRFLSPREPWSLGIPTQCIDEKTSLARMQKYFGLRGGLTRMDKRDSGLGGSICPSTVDLGFVSAVSISCPSSFTVTSGRVLTYFVEQFALTEASYTTVRLIQEFGSIESRDPEPWTERLNISCTVHNGCKVSLTPRH